MTEDKGIYIKNIYFMLTYAFGVLKQNNYSQISGEDYDHIYDLLAEILIRGIAKQLKHGLYREYVLKHENLSTVKGKMVINPTIENILNNKKKIFCEYDEYSENNIYNQIIKASILILLTNKDVSKERIKELKKLLLFFSNIDSISVELIPWRRLHYQKSNRNYEMIISICYFVIKSQLLTEENGSHKILGFSDENMSRLYEKFILEYYKTHYSMLNPRARKIPYTSEGKPNDFLPDMITDVYLTYGKKVLIIDAKYYGRTMQEKYSKKSFHSNNYNQIFSYVNHADRNHSGDVNGMLLYAKTNESVTPNDSFQDAGNVYWIRTLDLNKDSKELSNELNEIVNTVFGV